MRKLMMTISQEAVMLKRRILPIKQVKNTDIKKVLIIRSDLLGDIILSLPAIYAIKNHFPKSEIYFLVREEHIGLLKEIGFQDMHFIPYTPPKRKNFLSIIKNRLKYIFILRSIGFDISIDICYGDTFNLAVITFFSGIPIKIGFDVGRHGFLYTIHIKPPKEVFYETDYAFYLLKKAGIPLVKHDVDILIDDDKEKEILKKFKDFQSGNRRNVLINIGVSPTNQLKKWFNDRFAKLADLLAEKQLARVFFIGTSAHKDDAKEIISMMHTNAVDLIGKTTLIEVFYLINACDLLVTVNSGPMHLAALLKKPCVILSGPSGRKRWYKKTGYNCHIQKRLGCNNVDCIECKFDTVRCMEAISTEKVYSACKQMLDKMK